MASVGSASVDIIADLSGVQAQVANGLRGIGQSLTSTFSGLAGPAVTVFRDIGQAAGAASVAVGVLGAAAVHASTQFNAAISTVGATASATAVEMDLLRDAALEAGEATVFSATEAATAQAELARAGVSVSDILGGALRGSLDLAAAGQLDLASAAGIAAQAMNIFGLSGSDVGHVADVLAAGANTSATTVSQLGIAMRQAGIMAGQTGLTLEDTVGALALFADNALVGSDAGTSLRTMLQRLNPTSEEAAGTMRELGLTAFDASGEFIGLQGYAERLQTGLQGLSTEQRNNALTTIFGADAVRAANLLYEAGGEGIAEYTARVDDLGAAQRVASTMLDNLAGDLEAFSGSTETALIRTGDLADGLLRTVVQSATEIVNAYNDWADSPAFDAIRRRLDDISVSVLEVADTVRVELQDALDSIGIADINEVTDGIGDLTRVLAPVAPLVAGVGLAFSTMALRSLPLIGGFVPVIAPITGALGGLLLGTQEGRDALSELGDVFHDIAASVVPPLAEALGGLLPSAAGTFRDFIIDIAPDLRAFADDLRDLAIQVLPVLVDTFAGMAPVVADILGAGLALLGPAFEFMADHAETLVPLLIGMFVAWKALMIVSAVTAAIKGFSAAVAASNPWLLAVAGATVALGIVITSFVGDQRAAAAAARDYSDALRDQSVSTDDAIRAATLKRLEDQGQVDDLDRLNLTLDQYVEMLLRGADGLEQLRRAAVNAGEVAFANTEGFELTNEQLAEAQRLYIETGETMQFFSTGGSIVAQGNVGLADSFTANSEAMEAVTRAGLEAAVVNGQLTDSTRALILAENTAADGTTDWAAVNRELRDATVETEDAQDDLARAASRITLEFDAAATAADIFGRALNDLIGSTLDAEQAQIDALDAIAGVTEELDAESRSLDINTVAGRTNREAILGAAQAGIGLVQAMLREGASLEEAEFALNGHVGALREQLAAANFSEEAIAEYIATLNLTPEEIRTTIEAVNAEVAIERAEAFQGAIDELPAEHQTEFQALLDEGNFAALLTRFEELGVDIGEGVAVGIDRSADTVNRSSANLIAGALATAQRRGEMQSPSRLFARLVGEPIAEGVAQGILNALDAPDTAMETLTDRLAELGMSAVSSITSGLGSVFGAGRAQGNLADARQTLADLQAEQAGLPAQIARAEAEGAAAIARARTEGDAGITQAQARLEAMRRTFRPASEVAQAQRDLDEAIADAAEAVRDATEESDERLLDLARRQIDIDGELQAAEEDLRAAQLGVVSSQQAMLQAGADWLDQGPEAAENFRRIAEMAGLSAAEIDGFVASLNAAGAASTGAGLTAPAAPEPAPAVTIGAGDVATVAADSAFREGARGVFRQRIADAIGEQIRYQSFGDDATYERILDQYTDAYHALAFAVSQDVADQLLAQNLGYDAFADAARELARRATPRASGGPLEPGVPYRFGEQGAEIGVFGVPGQMLSNPQAERLVADSLSAPGDSGDWSGGPPTFHVYIGDRELVDIVDVRVEESGRRTLATAGRGRR